MMDMIRERGEPINTEDLYFATMDIKEKHGYLARDIVEEFGKFDQKDYDDITKTFTQNSRFKKYSGYVWNIFKNLKIFIKFFCRVGKITNKPYNIDIGYETFLGPEAFFSPEMIDKDFRTSIDELVDTTVQQCPIDYRRRLYSVINYFFKLYFFNL